MATSAARVSQAHVEVLATGTSDARIAQAHAEVLAKGTSDARFAQMHIEVLVTVVPATDAPVYGHFGFSL